MSGRGQWNLNMRLLKDEQVCKYEEWGVIKGMYTSRDGVKMLKKASKHFFRMWEKEGLRKVKEVCKTAVETTASEGKGISW